jgi:hypothetical protein
MQIKSKFVSSAAALCAAAFMFTSTAQAGPFDAMFGRSSGNGGGNRIQPIAPGNIGLTTPSRTGADDAANHDAGDNRGVNPQPGDDRGRGQHGPGHR